MSGGWFAAKGLKPGGARRRGEAPAALEASRDEKKSGRDAVRFFVEAASSRRTGRCAPGRHEVEHRDGQHRVGADARRNPSCVVAAIRTRQKKTLNQT